MKIITGPLSWFTLLYLLGGENLFSKDQSSSSTGSWRLGKTIPSEDSVPDNIVEKSECGFICVSIHQLAVSIYYFGDWIMLLLLKWVAMLVWIFHIWTWRWISKEENSNGGRIDTGTVWSVSIFSPPWVLFNCPFLFLPGQTFSTWQFEKKFSIRAT